MTTQFMTNYSYGENCFTDLPAVLATYGFQSLVLIGGEKALGAVEEELLSILQEAGIKVTASLIYGKMATQNNIDRLVLSAEVQAADVIIGIGGGQALDTSKMVAKETGKSLLTIPTICSTCAASTGLAVIYHPDHSFSYYGNSQAPLHTFINTRVIAQAPQEYFWAGIGDGISKGPEVRRALKEAVKRGFEPPHAALLGQAIAQSSLDSIYLHARQAMADVKKKHPTKAVEEVVLAIIVSTAYASNLLVQPTFDLTTCHAHAFYNGTTAIRSSRKHLHGAVVAFGVMVLHAYFKEFEELKTVAQFNQQLGLPICLADISLTEEDIPAIVAYSVTTDEYQNTPYDEEGFAEAIRLANQLGQGYNK